MMKCLVIFLFIISNSCLTASYKDVNAVSWQNQATLTPDTSVKKAVAKAFIKVRHQDLYLFACKNCPKRKNKHNRLELIGGKLDPAENFLTALKREFAEEDLSLTLSKAVQSNTKILSTDIIVKKSKNRSEPHRIYLIEITTEQLSKVLNYKTKSKEVLNFKTLTADEIKQLPEDMWTPKTRKIFRALASS